MALRPVSIDRRASALLAVLLLCIASPRHLRSQVLDSKGREFWVAFMANWGSLLTNETSHLLLYLSCDRPTTVTITYTGSGDSKFINLPVAKQTVEVNVNS